MAANRVLLVEPDDTLREVIAAVLSDEGFLVVRCESLAAAHLEAGQTAGDVALVDFWRPGALALCPSDRRQFGSPDRAFRLVVVTDHVLDPAVTATSLGVDAILPKPFDLADLLGAVRGTGASTGCPMAISGNAE